MRTSPGAQEHRPPSASLLKRTLIVVGIVALALAGACGSDDGGADYEGPANVIAFGAEEDGGTFALYTMTPDEGEEPIRLITEPEQILFPRWAPDGSRIAYLTGLDGGTTATLRIADVEAQTALTISENVLQAPSSGPAWSSDSERVAFIEAEDGGLLRIYDLDSGALSEIDDLAATEADWSSESDELAIVARGDLYVTDASGREPELFADAEGDIRGPRWSPDGERIAYASGDDAVLFVVTPGDEPVELGAGFQPAWAPGGDLLAYALPVGQRDETTDIYTIGAAGGEPEALTESITLDRWPAWAPDGTRVAYVALADPTTAFLCIADLELRSGDCPSLPQGLRPISVAWSPQ